MLVRDAISSIQPTADDEVRHAMHQPISALNGVIYSINESFLGPGCGSVGGMEGSNEEGKQPRMKECEKQAAGVQNTIYSGLSYRAKRRRSEESLSVDGVSVTHFYWK